MPGVCPGGKNPDCVLRQCYREKVTRPVQNAPKLTLAKSSKAWAPL
jgi:hypothetical protein